MAGVRLKVVTGDIATGTSLKTLCQVVAASNHGVLVEEASISFDGTSNSATPIKVRILRQTTAGTMSALTPVKDPDDVDETLQTTAQHSATAEPTAGDVLAAEKIHPQQGYTFYFPAGREIKIGGADRLGVDVLAGASVNAVVRFNLHE